MKRVYQISSKSFWEDIHNDFRDSGGVYKMFYRNNSAIQPINRMLGTDNTGTLYIGKAKSLLKRVTGLKKTLDPNMKSSPHICGRRYNKNVNIQKAFPFPNLYVELIKSDVPKEKETELLDEYFQKYGEVPPLNAI